MKRLLALFLVLTMALTACGGKETSEETQPANEETVTGETTEKDETNDETEPAEPAETAEGTIKLLVPGYDSGYLKDELDAAIGRFEEANPGSKVEIVTAGWDELNNKVVQLYQAGEAPDIMLLGSRSLKQFSEIGLCEPLDSFMDDEFVSKRVENVLDTGKVEGVQYGIPMAFSSRALYYRSDLIENPPTTWDELLETSKELVDSGEVKYGFAFPTDLVNGTDELLSFIYQGDGRIVDENGEFTINSENNIETLEWMQDFKELIPDPVATERDTQADLFINGDLGMFVTGTWEKEKMDGGADKTPYGVAVLPEGNVKSACLVTDSYVMSSISENKDLAWKFIDFMGQLDEQKEITAAYQWFPVLEAEQDLDVYKTDFMQPFMEIIPFGVPEVKVSDWDTFNKAFTIAVQKALTGEATAEEALNEAQAEVTK